MTRDEILTMLVNGPQNDSEKALFDESMAKIREVLQSTNVSTLVRHLAELILKHDVPIMPACLIAFQVGYQTHFMETQTTSHTPSPAEIVDKTLAQLGLRSQSNH